MSSQALEQATQLESLSFSFIIAVGRASNSILQFSTGKEFPKLSCCQGKLEKV